MKQIAEDMNLWRADAAGEALERFVEIVGGDLHGEREDMIGDLLCNLGHYCDLHKLDWEKLVTRARANIEHERKYPND